jgi:hypothetical protein
MLDKKVVSVVLGCAVMLLSSCHDRTDSAQTQKEQEMDYKGKPVVYQVFTRLFGNTNTTNKPWGTLEENGVGKFSDFTPKALEEIKALGYFITQPSRITVPLVCRETTPTWLRVAPVPPTP